MRDDPRAGQRPQPAPEPEQAAEPESRPASESGPAADLGSGSGLESGLGSERESGPESDPLDSAPTWPAGLRMATEPGKPSLVVQARGLSLNGKRGPVFLPVDLDVATGTLLVLAGPAGSGRTSLLLTLGGRMVPSTGVLRVAGEPLPERRRAVQYAVTLATMSGVNDLDGSLTVEEHVLERLALTSPWWRLLTPSTSDVPDVLAAVDDEGHPRLDRDAVVRDLVPYDRFRLGVALALAGRRRQPPRILIADDIDDLRDPRAVEAAWRLVFALAGSDRDRVPGGLTVITSCSAAGSIPDEVRIDERTVVHRVRRATASDPTTGTTTIDPAAGGPATGAATTDVHQESTR